MGQKGRKVSVAAVLIAYNGNKIYFISIFGSFILIILILSCHFRQYHINAPAFEPPYGNMVSNIIIGALNKLRRVMLSVYFGFINY